MVVLILKNLFRRKGRTILTIAGVSIGVAAIVALGAMAEGFEASYNSMLSGSQADYVISQPDAFDISMSSVDEELGEKLEAMSEVEAVSGMLEGFVQAEGIPYFFVFGYPEDSYVLSRFQIVEGDPLDAPQSSRGQGKPLLLGSAVAEVMEKSPGDTIRIGESVYRVVGIYETGEAFEDSAAVLSLREAQDLLGKTRQVSLFYIQLKDPSLGDRFAERQRRAVVSLARGDE
jgi:putative ABC transport system permease protein